MTGGRLGSETEAFFARWIAAVSEESRAGREEHEALAGRPLAERLAQGQVWPPLQRAGERPGRRGATIVSLRAPRGVLLHDGIGAGDPVRLGQPADAKVGIDGMVVDVGDTIAEVSVEGALPDAWNPVTVGLRHDDLPAKRQIEALRRAAREPGPVGRVLLGLSEGSLDEDVDLSALRGLEASQQRAAALALQTLGVSAIHGPPGTGKTEVIVALALAFRSRAKRPWVLAESNAAVDHAAVRCHEKGLKVVRLGAPARIGSAARALSLWSVVESGPFGPALARLDKEIGRARVAGGKALWALLSEREAIEDQAVAHALSGAEVFACTLSSLAREGERMVGPNKRGQVAIVDEATQAVEPSVWIAAPLVDQLVLVGDPHQLGPVVKVRGSPLGRSLLERVLDEEIAAAPMLEVQRRMNREIAGMVRGVYGEGYVPHESVAGHRLSGLRGVSAGLDEPLGFIDTAGSGVDEEIDPATRSLFNPLEVALVVQLVGLLRAEGVKDEDIGVIAPYSAQVGRLREALAGIEVNTVNAFQGREKEAIITSFVRSNPDGNLGFVADDRRLTVACTRARRWFRGVGDSATLGRHPRFAALFEEISAAGAMSSVWESPWNEALP